MKGIDGGFAVLLEVGSRFPMFHSCGDSFNLTVQREMNERSRLTLS